MRDRQKARKEMNDKEYAEILKGLAVPIHAVPAWDRAIELLEQEPKWTPVSEPPKKNGVYLVTMEIKEDLSYVSKLSYSHNLYSIDRFDFADKKRSGWYDFDSEYGYYEMDKVTAWMPLPKPYKAESEKA